MSLERIHLPDHWPDLETDILLLMEYGEDQIDAYQDGIGEQASPAFEPADYREVVEALYWIRHEYTDLPGLRFCEWGCGFGVVAGMAGLLGFESHGIENDELLVGQAHHVKRLFGLDSHIHHTDIYQPTSQDNAPLQPSSFDLIYAYPWPKEENRIMEYFDENARIGACILIYHGFADLSLHRKKA